MRPIDSEGDEICEGDFIAFNYSGAVAMGYVAQIESTTESWRKNFNNMKWKITVRRIGKRPGMSIVKNTHGILIITPGEEWVE